MSRFYQRRLELSERNLQDRAGFKLVTAPTLLSRWGQSDIASQPARLRQRSGLIVLWRRPLDWCWSRTTWWGRKERA